MKTFKLSTKKLSIGKSKMPRLKTAKIGLPKAKTPKLGKHTYATLKKG